MINLVSHVREAEQKMILHKAIMINITNNGKNSQAFYSHLGSNKKKEVKKNNQLYNHIPGQLPQSHIPVHCASQHTSNTKQKQNNIKLSFSFNVFTHLFFIILTMESLIII